MYIIIIIIIYYLSDLSKRLGGTKRHSLCEGASHNTNTVQYKYRTIYITDTTNKAKEQITKQEQIIVD